jgi:predicted Holliday junction resolvase-like endonuclease
VNESPLLLLLLAVLSAAVLVLAIRNDALRSQLHERIQAESDIRADAVKRSSAVVSGKVTEHLAPYMAEFPYDPRDARFLGTPVDLIVFDGLGDDALREIVFLEIKSRDAALSARERRVRDAVLERRVTWKEFRVKGAD